MDKYYEELDTGIYAPTLEELKKKIVDYYFESELQTIYSKGITYNNKLVFSNKARFTKSLDKILAILKGKDNDEVVIHHNSEEVVVFVSFMICSKGVDRFLVEAQEELDESYKELGGKFNEGGELVVKYDRGM